MSEIVITLEQLRRMIGVKVRYEGSFWRVIEVLEDGPSLVLESQQHPRVIQPDKFGDGHRRTAEYLTVPVLTPDRRELHPQFLALDLEEED
ncbi:MAG: hypothetical protein U5S82_00950 [Gammaproteobacteria bacterium]|nr:hypothetical protein [Gammaproteobacteria bacterium]